MLTMYCGNCGSKNEYISSKPKFCSNCGEPFDKAFSKKAPAKIEKHETTQVEKLESNGDDDISDRVRGSIYVDPNSIKVTNVPQKLTIGEIQKSREKFGRDSDKENTYVDDFVKKLKK